MLRAQTQSLVNGCPWYNICISLDVTLKASGCGKLGKLRLLEKLWWITHQYELNIISMVAALYSHTYCVLHFHSCTWNGTATLSKGLGHFKSQYFSVICTNLLKVYNRRCASIRHASRDRMQRSSHIKRAKMDDAATRNIIWHSAASGTSAVTGPSGRRSLHLGVRNPPAAWGHLLKAIQVN